MQVNIYLACTSTLTNSQYTAPDVQVTNLRVTGETDRSIGLAWTPVGCVERSNLPIRVRIITRVLPSMSIVGIGNAADEGSYNRARLEMGSFYSFQVLAAGLEKAFGINGPTVTGITSAPGKISSYENVTTTISFLN